MFSIVFDIFFAPGSLKLGSTSKRCCAVGAVGDCGMLKIYSPQMSHWPHPQRQRPGSWQLSEEPPTKIWQMISNAKSLEVRDKTPLIHIDTSLIQTLHTFVILCSLYPFGSLCTVSACDELAMRCISVRLQFTDCFFKKSVKKTSRHAMIAVQPISTLSNNLTQFLREETADCAVDLSPAGFPTIGRS